MRTTFALPSSLLLAAALTLTLITPQTASAQPQSPGCTVQLAYIATPAPPGTVVDSTAQARVDRAMPCSELSRQGWQTIWSLIGPRAPVGPDYDEVFLVPLAIDGDPATDDAIGSFAVVPRTIVDGAAAPIAVWGFPRDVAGVLVIKIGDPGPLWVDPEIATQLLTGFGAPRPTAAEGQSWLQGFLPELDPPEPSITERTPRVIGRPGAQLAPGSPVQPAAVPVPCLIEAQCLSDQFAIGIRFRF